MKNFARYFLAAALPFLAIFAAYKNVRIINILTPSVPYKCCVNLMKVYPRRGDLFVFKRNGEIFVKFLVGVEGDEIRNVDDNIYVGFWPVGAAPKTKRLTPIKDRIIPKGYVFAAGTHEDSLDCRYEEFGLVKVSDIEGKAIGFSKW
jgi:signal peptidase I